MDEELVALVGATLALIAFDLAALRFGVNSRDGKREMPTGAELSGFPLAKGRRMRSWRHARHKDGAEQVVTRLLVLHASAPEGTPATHEIQEFDLSGAGTTQARRWVGPRTLASPHSYLQLDLVTRGK